MNTCTCRTAPPRSTTQHHNTALTRASLVTSTSILAHCQDRRRLVTLETVYIRDIRPIINIQTKHSTSLSLYDKVFALIFLSRINFPVFNRAMRGARNELFSFILQRWLLQTVLLGIVFWRRLQVNPIGFGLLHLTVHFGYKCDWDADKGCLQCNPSIWKCIRYLGAVFQ